MAGFFCIGLLFSAEHAQSLIAPDVAIYIAISFCFVLSVYSFNAWAGYPKDKQNPRLQQIVKVSRGFHLVLSICLLCVALIVYGYLLRILPLLALAAWGLWAMYSAGRPKLVRKPFVGTFMHFVAQLIHFQLAYLLLAPPSAASVLIGIYFALLFSAGHFYHEVIDYAADQASGKVTGAVSFGKRTALRLSDIVFTLAQFLWLVLWETELISWLQFVAFAGAYLLQLLTYLIVRSRRLTGRYTFLYQNTYRIYYMLAGLAVLLHTLVVGR
jgi:4-hydroxybenzoate polyprenyltransferase